MLTFNQWLLEREEDYIRKLMTRKPARNLPPRERMASSLQGMRQIPDDELPDEFDDDDFSDEDEFYGKRLSDEEYYQRYGSPRYRYLGAGEPGPEPGKAAAFAKQMAKFKDFVAQDKKDQIEKKKKIQREKKAQRKRVEKRKEERDQLRLQRSMETPREKEAQRELRNERQKQRRQEQQDADMPRLTRKQRLADEAVRAKFHEIVPQLDDVTRQIIELRFGINGPSKSVKDTARILGLPVGRISVITNKTWNSILQKIGFKYARDYSYPVNAWAMGLGKHREGKDHPVDRERTALITASPKRQAEMKSGKINRWPPERHSRYDVGPEFDR